MQLHAHRLLLSPSDVTAYLACEHLTTLSLRAARGEVAKPDVPDEQCDLVFRKGLEYEQAYLESSARMERSVATIELDDRDWDAHEAQAGRRHRAADARRGAARPRLADLVVIGGSTELGYKVSTLYTRERGGPPVITARGAGWRRSPARSSSTCAAVRISVQPHDARGTA